MKKFLFLFAAVLLLAACSTSPKFHVQGTIEDAEGEMLYLEAMTLEGIVVSDSVRLKADGRFEFSESKTVENPEFYALRVGQQRIHFSIDSTETLTFTAKMPLMARDYTVSGSAVAQEIRDISVAQQQLQEQIHQLEFNEVILGENFDTIHTLIADYKERMKRDYILKHPQQASAYFAVCQSLTYRYSTFRLFDAVSERDDAKCYAAVATAWDGRWPDAERTIQLCNMAIKGMENTAPPTKREVIIDEDKITETGIIDVELPDINGTQRRLSDLRGHVVLLDFTMYGAKESAARTRAMRELYNKYKERGLEIYQVSLDDDIHFWKFSCENLPWVCVHETDGRATTSYAINSLPTYFLINRDNEIVVRSEMVRDLETELLKLL
ncbi:MAG: redoxin domain-containing protein [Bacteroidaceae bacterium]|nr:redoxin domain-containing protein [Bacteroidaceae bacterium]